MVDALGMVVHLDGLLAALAHAVAQHRTLFPIAANLHHAVGLGVGADDDAAVHVAVEAAGIRPLDTGLVDVLVRHVGRKLDLDPFGLLKFH